jgi:hypothetical protein
LRGLTLELSRAQRHGTLAVRGNMYQGAARPGWHAVARRLERRVRRRVLGLHIVSASVAELAVATEHSAPELGNACLRGGPVRSFCSARCTRRLRGRRDVGHAPGRCQMHKVPEQCRAARALDARASVPSSAGVNPCDRSAPLRGCLFTARSAAGDCGSRTGAALATPNVGVEVGPAAQGQACEAHHAPRRFAGLVLCRWASPRTTG